MSGGGFAIKNASQRLQWHVDRAGMTNLLVNKSMLLADKQRVVANLVAAVCVLMQSQVKSLIGDMLISDYNNKVIAVTLDDEDVREWIRDGDCSVFDVCLAPKKWVVLSRKQQQQQPKLGRIAMSLKGTISGVSFTIQIVLSTDTSCIVPGCTERDCVSSCNGCGVRYCGLDHQKQDWPTHQQACDKWFSDLVDSFVGIIGNQTTKRK